MNCFRLIFPVVFTLSFLTPLSAGGFAPGMLGVSLDEVGTGLVSSLDLPGEFGARVLAVGPGTPAEAIGLKADDVIVAYNGQHVESARALSRMVRETPAGRQVELRYIRDGKPMLASPVLGVGQAEPATAAAAPPKSLGVWIESIAPAVGQYLELEEGIGVIVREVKEGSAADRAGIQAKDVLTGLNGGPVTTPEALSESIRALPGYEATISLVRGGESMDLTVRF